LEQLHWHIIGRRYQDRLSEASKTSDRAPGDSQRQGLIDRPGIETIGIVGRSSPKPIVAMLRIGPISQSGDDAFVSI